MTPYNTNDQWKASIYLTFGQLQCILSYNCSFVLYDVNFLLGTASCIDFYIILSFRGFFTYRNSPKHAFETFWNFWINQSSCFRNPIEQTDR